MRKLSALAVIATVGGAALLGSATVDVQPAQARGQPEYDMCIAPFAEDYARSMNYCVERIGPRYGHSSIEFESCVWYAQTSWDNIQQACSDQHL